MAPAARADGFPAEDREPELELVHAKDAVEIESLFLLRTIVRR